MLYILLSICCSVAVATLLKYLKRFPIALEQIVNFNYLSAIVLSWCLFKPEIQKINFTVLSPIYFASWLLLPAIFIILGLSVKNIGIAKTDIAQRMSLFIPVLAAYFLFHENIKYLKILGLCVGFISIVFTLYKRNKSDEHSNYWLYPLVVFIGFGIIDLLFKQIAVTKEISFTTSLFIVFCGAFAIATCISLFYIISKKSDFQSKSIIWGLFLGVLNFGNIFFYLKAHQVLANNPSTVFASMNFGVIALGSFIGIVVFKEKLSKMNYLGIFMAIIAVIIITFSQVYES